MSIRVVAYRRTAFDDTAWLAYASLAPVAYLVPGVVLVVRRGGHVVGWLLCVLALGVGVGVGRRG